MNTELLQAYKDLRAPRWSDTYTQLFPGQTAKHAIYFARQRLETQKALANWEALEAQDMVRIRLEPDPYFRVEDMLGDTFDAAVNSHINPNVLKREEREYLAMLEREGVWGIIGEYRLNDGSWTCGGSCWGFEGSYAETAEAQADIKLETLDNFRRQTYCVTCHKAK